MTREQILCQQACERLSAYLDGELSPLEALGIEAHLSDCPPCRSQLATLETLSGLIASEGRRLPPVPAWKTIEARLESDALRAWSGHPRRVALLAATLLVAAGGAWLLAVLEPTGRGAPGRVSGKTAPEEGPASDRSIRTAGLGLPGLEQFLTRHQAVEVELSDLERSLREREARLPPTLPVGLNLEKAFLIEGPSCSGVCFLFRDRQNRYVGLVQQPPSRPFLWQDAALVRERISGLECRRARLPKVELTQIDPQGRNLTLVVARGFPGTDELIRYLAADGGSPSGCLLSGSQQDCGGR